jgi:hypothetical protein
MHSCEVVNADWSAPHWQAHGLTIANDYLRGAIINQNNAQLVTIANNPSF